MAFKSQHGASSDGESRSGGAGVAGATGSPEDFAIDRDDVALPIDALRSQPRAQRLIELSEIGVLQGVGIGVGHRHAPFALLPTASKALNDRLGQRLSPGGDLGHRLPPGQHATQKTGKNATPRVLPYLARIRNML